MKEIEAEYRRRYETTLKSVAAALETQIRDYLTSSPRIDRVSVRAKDPSSFIRKSVKTDDGGKPRYEDPFSQIQDQIGARIITLYLSDVVRLHPFIMRYYRPIEMKDHIPDSESEFGYFGKHYILFLPSDVIAAGVDKRSVPKFFELQIKTLFQHAWSEAEHDLAYKPGAKPLTADEKRRFAFTSAQSWGADRIFEELFQERGGNENQISKTPAPGS